VIEKKGREVMDRVLGKAVRKIAEAVTDDMNRADIRAGCLQTLNALDLYKRYDRGEIALAVSLAEPDDPDDLDE